MNAQNPQYHLDSMEDLEKADMDREFSFEDFISQHAQHPQRGYHPERDAPGGRLRDPISLPARPSATTSSTSRTIRSLKAESLSEILISTGAAGATDAAKADAAKAKAEDIEARLHAGGDFSQLAKSFSDGPTAAQGGDLGQYQRGALPKRSRTRPSP